MIPFLLALVFSAGPGHWPKPRHVSCPVFHTATNDALCRLLRAGIVRRES